MAASFGENVRSQYPIIISPKAEISIEAGWEKLVKEMLEEIMLQPDHASIRISIIKQKFASVRVHFGGYASEAIKQIIRRAEARADCTCEFCGCETTRSAWINFWQMMCCEKCEAEKTPLDTPYGD